MITKPIIAEKITVKERELIQGAKGAHEINRGDVIATIIFNGDHYNKLSRSNFCYTNLLNEVTEEPEHEILVKNLETSNGLTYDNLIYKGTLEELVGEIEAGSVIEFFSTKENNTTFIGGYAIISFSPQKRYKPTTKGKQVMGQIIPFPARNK